MRTVSTKISPLHLTHRLLTEFVTCHSKENDHQGHNDFPRPSASAPSAPPTLVPTLRHLLRSGWVWAEVGCLSTGRWQLDGRLSMTSQRKHKQNTLQTRRRRRRGRLCGFCHGAPVGGRFKVTEGLEGVSGWEVEMKRIRGVFFSFYFGCFHGHTSNVNFLLCTCVALNYM